MKNSHNIILNVDSYKLSMPVQYPPGTTNVFSYIESRGGGHGYTVFFGLQAFIREYLSTPVTMEHINFADLFLKQHGVPFNRAGWEYIVNVHGGRLPVIIRAAKEGSVIPTKNVLLTIENTDPECFWLTTHLETALLRAIWYPTGVATQSHNIKKIIARYLDFTGDISGLPFKLHDFGARGVSSMESARLGGTAHLINFMGTDTISGILAAMEYYDADVCGFSIPAAEHSTITSWGKSNEKDAYENMLTKFAKPGSIVAVVSDSYDVFNAVQNIWGGELRQKVIDSGATVVIRPDSGDPVFVCSQLVDILAEKFGYSVNNKGYKVLNNVRLIQGDGVNHEIIDKILHSFMSNGYSADNIAFGMGGALLQKVDRDTQKFAMKCSSAKINGVWVDVFKDPITDPGKTSKAGRVNLWKSGSDYVSAINKPSSWTDRGFEWEDAMVTVFKDGIICNSVTFDEIRDNAWAK